MDFVKNISETFSERLRSPFLASFVFSMLSLNWKAIAIILAGNGTMSARIYHVEETYFCWWAWSIFIALVFAFLYTAFFPWLTASFDGITAKARVNSDLSKHARLAQESDRLMREAENRLRIKKAIEEIDSIDRLVEHNNKLKESNKQLMDASNEAGLNVKRLKSDVSGYRKRLEFYAFKNSANFNIVESVFKKIGGQSTIHEGDFDRDTLKILLQLNILKLPIDSSIYQFSTKGNLFKSEWSIDFKRSIKK